MKEIYLDNNATTLLRPIFRPSAAALLEKPLGNPASPHSWGDNAGRILAECRARLADFLTAQDEQFIFTSGGSEANTQVLRSFAQSHDRRVKFISTAVEHSSVLQALRRLRSEGHDVSILPVDSQGVIRAEDFERELRANGPILVSIQWANNETGVIQDIPMLLGMAHRAGARFHTDAAQAVGKLHIDLECVPVDYLTFTGHKIHAPAGVGVVFARSPRTLRPLIEGGEQEGGLRPGTPNTFGIGMLSIAISDRAAHMDEHQMYQRSIRDVFERALLERLPGISINGDMHRRICNTTNVMFREIDGSALLANLDREGVICSQSSACTSRTPEPSHVLTAMGFSDDEAWSSVRFSFSVDNTKDEAKEAAERVIRVAEHIWKGDLAICC